MRSSCGENIYLILIIFTTGDQLPCPDGESSENGFTPDCGGIYAY